ncbi:citrate transporter [Clostridium sp. YIM B02515]|uniref:Citrate transporter n=1 Tax=Clostridium rhizosphaerae TaxID=2803861 RepID=A0ABS1TFS3_9CLOT|nr:citrate:proton symporter [Clostridium rhizosphaerae]MBL4938220.1 citrate transporter [Clostridium rhizosphaerae]
MTLLAGLGYLTVVVFMVLIMTKKLSPFTSLIIVPIIFAIIGGFTNKLPAFIQAGLKGVATTSFMLFFAILFFGIMLTVGLFDPLVNKVIKLVKGDPLKILIGTAVLAAIVSLDGDGATTDIIVCSALVPIYNKLKIKKMYLAALVVLMNTILNLIPWGGPTARVAATTNIDGGVLMKPFLPAMVIGIIYILVVAYWLGLKERKRLGITTLDGASHGEMAATLTEEELALKRPKLVFVNFIITILVLVALLSQKVPANVAFEIGTALALIVNFRTLKDQRSAISFQADSIIHTVGMILAAGVFMGILTESKMAEAMGNHIVSLVPASMGSHFLGITSLLSIPGTFFLSNDAYYFGVLPVLLKAGAAYGFSNLQIGIAALTGQAVHLLSPLVASIYLLLNLTDQDLGEWQKFCFPITMGLFVIYVVTLAIGGVLPL